MKLIHPPTAQTRRRDRRRGARRAGRRGLLLVGQLVVRPACRRPSSSRRRSGQAASGQKVTLTFWTWVPNMDKVVAIWNKAHPDIQVQVQAQAGGDAELTKLLTAAKAGNPPDLAQVEYQVLPTLVSNNYLADISQVRRQPEERLPRGQLEPGDAGQQRAVRRTAGRRADGAVLPRGPVQEVRPDRADDLGAVRRRRDQAARRGARRLPGLVLRRRPRRVRRPDAAGGRAVVVRLRQHLDGRHRRRRQPEGRLVLAGPGGRGRRGQPAAVDRRLEQGHERRQVHRLGLRRLGARRLPDHGAGRRGQVGR